MFRHEVQRPTRAIRLMQMFGSTLAGTRMNPRGWVFETKWDGGLEEAVVTSDGLAEWGHRISGSGRHNKAMLQDLLAAEFEADAADDDLDVTWDEMWAQLLLAFFKSREHRELVRFDWPSPHSDSTLYLFANRQAGVALIVNEELKTLRSSWASNDPSLAQS